MRIAIITDLHINLDNEPSHNVDTRANTLSVLQAVAQRSPDHVLILGDLCLKGPRTETYQWFRQEIEKLGLPYQLIAGNHDSAKMMADAFDLELTNGALFYQTQLDQYPFLFLDSSSGNVSDDQLDWLRANLQPAPHTFLVIHHPPILMGVAHMDQNHSLANGDEIMAILKDFDHPVTVLSGHYHVDREIQAGKVRVIVTASCYFQIDPFSPEFQIDHFQISYRILDLSPERHMHSVFYLDGRRLQS